jgi:phosphoglycolate phosphatase-like HAD superfamily hydrolase
MMKDPDKILRGLKATKDFFIGFDSDGCVFDTMELKQKECLCPSFIKHYKLQSISKYARETWEYVNLYSASRGTNRFLGLIETMDLLEERREIRERGVELADLGALKKWVEKEDKLGIPSLKKYALSTGNSEIDRALIWSLEVNETISDMVHGLKPFPYVRECLEKISGKADVMVISTTTEDALKREWKEGDIDSFTRILGGQEFGSKKAQIANAAVGKYSMDRILMVGDAPGDRLAAQDNGVLFFPINPGKEETSWEMLYEEGLDRFFKGDFAGDYQKQLLESFEDSILEFPPWS